MNHLIFYTATNKKGKSDATGAFIPEAVKLGKYLEAVYPDSHVAKCGIDTDRSSSEMRDQVEMELDKLNLAGVEFDAIWFLCHGYQGGIQYGYKWKSGAARLVREVTKYNPKVQMISFYSCLVSKDTGNFASWVFWELFKRSGAKDVQVFGHYTRGHTTMNPRIKIYSSGFAPFMWSIKTYSDYNQLVEPSQSKKMRAMMKDNDSNLRYAIAFVPRMLKKFKMTNGLKR